MPLSSNRAKNRTPLSSLVAGKEATNSLNIFSQGNTKTATAKIKNTSSSRVALTNPVQGTRATCRQGEEAYKGGTNRRLRWHH
jgi:hypothetical protein